MTRPAAHITNPFTGQRMIFRVTGKDSNGSLLEIETFNPPTTEREPIHIHPKQISSCEVISGKVHFEVDGNTKVLGPGETIEVPAGVPHRFWNEDASEEAHTIQRFSPSLNTDEFFITYFAWARDGKLNKKGLPNLVRMSRPALYHQHAIQVVKPPWYIQKIIFTTLAPLARILGYPEKYK